MREYSTAQQVERPDDGQPDRRRGRQRHASTPTPWCSPADARPAASWADVTAGEFLDEVRAVAKGLIAAGVEAGDRVALISRTRYEWTLFDYAIWFAGAATVPIYETSSAEQIEWILADSGARAVVRRDRRARRAVKEVRDRLPELHHVWSHRRQRRRRPDDARARRHRRAARGAPYGGRTRTTSPP